METTTEVQVTWETKGYEKDWKELLTTGRLQQAIDNHRFSFAERILFINNGSRPQLVARHAKRLVNEGVLTSYVIVDDYKDEALAFFGLNEGSFKGGY